MRFGLESEKIIYDLKKHKISSSAQRILEALDDYKIIYGDDDVNRVTGEFVHHMIEMASSPSDNIFEVVRDYLFSYDLVRDTCDRFHHKTLPIASYPAHITPIMKSKWEYYIQNAILSQNLDIGWDLEPQHGLFPASNCAGVHMHVELDTLPEHLTFTTELADKFNLALSLAPLVAFAASPYFIGKHSAVSMRAKSYFMGVYKGKPYGEIPPVFETSADILKYFRHALLTWEKEGADLGLDPKELHRIYNKKGAAWNMIRWNRTWNTVEMRCFDTDFVGMDVGKFALCTSILKRTDLQGEQLQVNILKVNESLDVDQAIKESLDEVFEVENGKVNIFPTKLLHRIMELAVNEGLSHDLVHAYIGKIFALSRETRDWKEEWLFETIAKSYEERLSTADKILQMTGHKTEIDSSEAGPVLEWVLGEEEIQFQKLRESLPRKFQPPESHPFPKALS